ncbi:MAG: hypothetical protein ACOZIN_13160 [Myxococcota bacterium]
MLRFAAVALLALTACGVPPPPSVEALPPHVTLYGVRMRTFRDAELVSFGRAAKLVYNRSTAHFTATEVALSFPGTSFSGVELRAPQMNGHLPSRLAEGSGGVLVRTSAGLTGKTERARFDGQARRAEGELPVKLEGPSYSLAAQGFDFDFATERYRFTGGVTSRFGGAW